MDSKIPGLFRAKLVKTGQYCCPATAPRGEVKRYPVGHFDIYLGEPFEHAVADQTEFLVRHLGVA